MERNIYYSHNLGDAGEPVSKTEVLKYSYDEAKAIIFERITSFSVQDITLEGFPLRENPSPNHPYLSHRSPVFISSMLFLGDVKNILQQKFPNVRIRHCVLIDDLVYPGNDWGIENDASISSPQKSIQQSLDRIQHNANLVLPILSSFDNGIRETQIDTAARAKYRIAYKKTGIASTCEERDRDYQLRMKMLPGVYPLLNIVLHPIPYEKQQEDTITGIFQKLGSKYAPLYTRDMSTEDKRIFLQNSYLHIWMNKKGQIVDITSPIFDRKKNGFYHESVSKISTKFQEEIFTRGGTVSLELQEQQDSFWENFYEAALQTSVYTRMKEKKRKLIELYLTQTPSYDSLVSQGLAVTVEEARLIIEKGITDIFMSLPQPLRRQYNIENILKKISNDDNVNGQG